jgi:hypothetical protein
MQMQFIETADGLINSDRIVRVIERNDSSVIEYLDASGKAKQAHADMPPCIVQNMLEPIVAAAPGFFVVHFESNTMMSEPIVAWRITEFGSEPISTNRLEQVDRSAVMHPSGEVVYDDERFATLHDFQRARVAEIARGNVEVAKLDS